MARNQISTYVEDRISQLSCLSKTETMNGLFSMLIVVVIMSKSSYINAAEIAVLTCYLVIEAITKLPIIIGIFLIAISPILCILMICYCCCCAKGHG